MFLRPKGYAQIVNGGAPSVADLDHVTRLPIGEGLTETDTFSCGHCNRVVHVPARSDPANIGGLCRVCMRLVCPTCVGGACDVIERKLERAERRADFDRWLDECAG